MTQRLRRLAMALPLLALACDGGPAARPTQILPRASVVELLSGDASGFARADAPRPFTFPDDHGPHPDFRTEWWYFTGHLETGSGRRFGYQFTVFRNAISAVEPEIDSAWATRQLYMAHLAVTDVAAERFHSFERFSRGALGLAGARGRPLEVWLEDWRVEALEAGGGPPLRLSAGEGEVRIELTLESGKQPVLQGDDGLSQKGAAAGNASYYYSLTRMPTRGRVTVGSDSWEVSGASWMDREWSTSALEADQVGWDWFSLQLADGTELMFYRLRERSGKTSRFSAGSHVGVDGESRKLASNQVRITELDTWTSPVTGSVYPSGWRLEVPVLDLELELEPALDDQELRHTFGYWEGAVDVRSAGGLDGRGYVELTGY